MELVITVVELLGGRGKTTVVRNMDFESVCAFLGKIDSSSKSPANKRYDAPQHSRRVCIYCHQAVLKACESITIESDTILSDISLPPATNSLYSFLLAEHKKQFLTEAVLSLRSIKIL